MGSLVRLIFLVCLSASAFAAAPLSPVKGSLDLSGHDFDVAPLVDLNGEWEFHWLKLWDPSYFLDQNQREASYFRFPHDWEGGEAQGQLLTAEGYATYHLMLQLPPHLTQIGLRLPYFYGWHRLFLNGELVHEGGRYRGSKQATSSDGSGFYVFYNVKNPTLHIVVQTASYQNAFGGSAESMTVGPVESIAHMQSFALSFDCFIISAIFFMAIYHGALFHMRRKDKSTLLFSMFCFLIAGRALAVGEGKIIHTLLGISGLWAWRAELITYYLGIPTITAFICALYPDETKKRLLYPSLWLTGVSSLVVLFTPSTLFTYTLPPIQLLTLVLIAVYSVFLIKAALHKRDGAAIFLIGFSLLAGFSIIEIISLRFSISIPRVSSVGLYIFIFFQAALLAKRFNAAFRQVEQNEKRILKLNHELSEQERVRTMFFHNTSHELRTPLHGILAFGNMIRRGAYGTIPDRVGVNLEKIEKLAESLMVQVNTILDLAKSRKGEMKLINSIIPLDEIMEEAAVIGEGLLIKAGNTTFTMTKGWNDEEKETLVGDREKIVTIIRNLMGNAFKFRDPDQTNDVALDLTKTSEGYLVITISDTGIGIDSHDHAVIFEEFRQLQGDVRRTYEGTGLGLAMVKTLVELMGGRIELTSTRGEGSCFTVRLPEQEKITLRKVQPGESEIVLPLVNNEKSLKTSHQHTFATCDATTKKAHHILVVDDNRINCEVIDDILSLDGYPVALAYGGKEALDSMMVKAPDLVLLDLMMPEVSGEDVLKAMKADAGLAQIPVIILTARASQEDRLMGLGIGADDYLAKPVMAEELLLRVSNTLSRLQLAKANAEKKMLESSLAEAQKVHSSLGSDDRQIPGVHIASFYQSAEMAGGDWFGFNYDQKKNRLYLLIGDVSGHDMLSALVTVASAGSFKGAMSLIKELGEGKSMTECLTLLAGILNDSVNDSGRHAGKAMSIAIIAIDLSSGEVAYLNAGHTPLLHVKHDGVAVHLTPANPLGFSPYPDLSCKRLALKNGDGLFVYTDGLTDNEGPSGKKLSMRVVKRILQQEKNPENVKTHILENCRLIWQTKLAKDDCSFIFLRWEDQASVHGPEVKKVG